MLYRLINKLKAYQSTTIYKISITLFVVCILLPFLSYSQQTPIKRVEIVVTAKEKPETSIIQLPANNLPTTPAVKTRTKTYAKRKIIRSSSKRIKTISPIAKLKSKAPLPSNFAEPVKSKQVLVNPKQELIKSKQQPLPNQTSLSKLKPNSQLENSITDTSKSFQKEEKPVVKNDKSKVVIVKNNNIDNFNAQISDTDKQNTITYIWIGVILIVAGIVLGLLFGRTAFLVSFIGVIFILLGVFIF